jgi:hypothetical protein
MLGLDPLHYFRVRLTIGQSQPVGVGDAPGDGALEPVAVFQRHCSDVAAGVAEPAEAGHLPEAFLTHSHMIGVRKRITLSPMAMAQYL